MASLFADGFSVGAEGAGLPRWVHRVPALGPLIGGATVPLTAPVTFVVGENGSGKSTLVEAIAERFGLDARGGRAAVLGGNLDTEKTPLGEALRLHLTHRGLAMRRGPRTARHGFFLRAETVLEMNERWRDLELVRHWQRFVDHPETYLGELVTATVEPAAEPERTVAPEDERELIRRLRARIHGED
ncbi:hypothetical protein AXK56_02840 [Tsukamurella pulmonis]|uniref:Rad50/SbcC-type AAA domain-containing protein n=1 Tax=Tsukamurella pulmonis TaxID=47312 RepID=A0A1H1E7B5_9ACTN|nr:AAA family ATPase [Tsukamurella pulmonis]KXO92054.1 hypothetical protein AXK56_02840 [Tsukamurella pulmonis]SDQ84617.1 hypothetical protein SAMN04489765_2068 [Tsukamurella pulmonis]SUP21225.1 Uncharacterised protein [Tsukamurella pulmonis]